MRSILGTRSHIWKYSSPNPLVHGGCCPGCFPKAKWWQSLVSRTGWNQASWIQMDSDTYLVTWEIHPGISETLCSWGDRPDTGN